MNEHTGRWSPLWWRVPLWAVVIAVSVYDTHDRTAKITVGAVMAVGAIALQFVSVDDVLVQRCAVLIATVAGLAACLAGPRGLAEILIFVAAARFPQVFDGRLLAGLVTVDAVATGVVLAVITNSVPGALVGLGVPVVVQRSVEHRDLVRERDRATALLAEVERGRESEAQAAALQERGRIAREMHDVLAHSLAGLSVQLQAVRAVAAREQVGPAVLEPLDRAATLARDGVAEARAAVSTLRDPVGLGLDAVPDLVDRFPGDARFGREGVPGTVSAEAGHAVYRAVQESLTNAARYAPGGTVHVTLAWAPGRLTATVLDTGPAAGREAVPGVGTGLGLAGMAERLTAVDGTVRAGPHGAGWQVEMDVPATVGPDR
ncbi:sensor histidine kinase [uncultured Jatrophihabitans sp.]|uniref:sensor histidine kinase n=1 Tax=uncultured Jatrophihabitans sp. TaxID=1610747 RepID=UPI0035CA7924